MRTIKLDYDCLRDVLIAIEDHSAFTESLEYNSLTAEDYFMYMLPQYDKTTVLHTIKKLEEAGFIVYSDSNSNHFPQNPAGIVIFDLSFQGYQYLDSVRSPERWERIKQIAQDKALILSINVIGAIVSHMVIAAL